MIDRLRAPAPLLFAIALAVLLVVMVGCTGQVGDREPTGGKQEPRTMRLEIVEQWAESSHARPITFAAEEEGCKNCHDGQTFTQAGGGFQPRFEAETTGSAGATGSAETTPPRDWVVATDCRVCHTAAGVRIAEAGEVEQIPSLDRAEGGYGALCMACHNGWHGAGARDGELGAPHGSVQTDMFFGVNTVPVEAQGGATQSEVESESPHAKVTDTCVGCHVSGGDSPNHTFVVQSFEGCKRKDCHKSDMTDGGTAKEDFDGDGTTEKYQVEVEGLLDALEAAINQSAGTSSFTSAQGNVVFEGGQVTATDPAYAAAYNYLFVVDDRSRGVHNPKFTMRLLQDSLASVGGGTQGGGTGTETTTP